MPNCLESSLTKDATGIYPFNRDIFSEAVFAPSLVTDRALDESTITSSPKSPASPVVPTLESVLVRSPEEIRPFPKIRPSSSIRWVSRKRGRTRILTDTPEKREIASRKEKKTSKPTNKKWNTKKVPTECQNQIVKTSSDESLHCGESENDFEDLNNCEFESKAFVLVRFSLGTSHSPDVYQVGQIKKKLENNLEISFLRRSGSFFCVSRD